MPTLSSNWKKLQAKLQEESRNSTTVASKRKPDNPEHPSAKRRQTRGTTPGTKRLTSRKIESMGGVQSRNVENESQSSPMPGIGSFAAANQPSSETIADAYRLGISDTSSFLSSANDVVNAGFGKGSVVGKYVAIDCEMVGVGPGGYESALARVSMVDFHGKQIYDSFVKPKEHVTDWRTQYSGVSPKEMRNARLFEAVQREVYQVIHKRILIGHDIKHDLDALKLSHPAADIRDTSRHLSFKKRGHGRKPALRILAKELLGVDIQTGAHSSLEDARVALLLFRRFKSEFDVDHANRYAPKTVATAGSGKHQKAFQKKKKRR